jgi:hypothetical protein
MVLFTVLNGIALLTLLALDPALACIRPMNTESIALVDKALPNAKLSAAKLAKVKELREEAADLQRAHKYVDADEAINRAMKMLGIKPPRRVVGGFPTRC